METQVQNPSADCRWLSSDFSRWETVLPQSWAVFVAVASGYGQPELPLPVWMVDPPQALPLRLPHLHVRRPSGKRAACLDFPAWLCFGIASGRISWRFPCWRSALWLGHLGPGVLAQLCNGRCIAAVSQIQPDPTCAGFSPVAGGLSGAVRLHNAVCPVPYPVNPVFRSNPYHISSPLPA